MDNEVPCRDTDPVNMNLVNKSGDTMAFTIDFGNKTELNQEEKVKKFERFAQRSSLRRVNSPRQQGEKEKMTDDVKTNNNNNNTCDKDTKKSENKANTSTTSSTPSPSAKDRRNTVVLEKPSIRSLSQSRLSSVVRKSVGAMRKSVSGVSGAGNNDDALSHTGTYTMEEEHDIKKVNTICQIFLRSKYFLTK